MIPTRPELFTPGEEQQLDQGVCQRASVAADDSSVRSVAVPYEENKVQDFSH